MLEKLRLLYLAKPLIFLFVLLNVLILHIYLFYNYPIESKMPELQKETNYIAKLSILYEEKQEIKKIAPQVKTPYINKKIIKHEKRKPQVTKTVQTQENSNIVPEEQELKKDEVLANVEQCEEQNLEQNLEQNVEENGVQKSRKKVIDTKSQEKYLNEYIVYVKSTILKNKFYPKVAKNMGIEGQCTLLLTLLKNGKIQDRNIIQKSNFSIFNTSALKIIDEIKYFEAFPDLLEKEMISLKIPLKYTLKG
jgi:protein TonB